MRSLLLSCVFAMAFAASAHGKLLTADQIRDVEPLLPYFTWLVDPEGKQSIATVSTGSLQERFAPLANGIPLKSRGAVWLRLVIVKSPPSPTGGTASERSRLVMRLGELPSGGAQMFISESPGPVSAPGVWHSEILASHSETVLPEPGLLPMSVYLRLDSMPGLWFSPTISPQGAVRPAMLPSELVLPGILIVACAACLLRAIATRSQWGLWAALFLACVLAQAVMPLPVQDRAFELRDLPALLAPGMALLLLPHVGRCMFRTNAVSTLQDAALYLCSIIGVAVCLVPLVPGMSWLARLFPLWPLLLFPLLPVCVSALANKRPGALSFSGACAMSMLGAVLSLYAIGLPSPHPLAAKGSLWGLAVGGLGLALARIPRDEAEEEGDTDERLSFVGTTSARTDPGSAGESESGEIRSAPLPSLAMPAAGGQSTPSPLSMDISQLARTDSEEGGRPAPEEGPAVGAVSSPPAFAAAESVTRPEDSPAEDAKAWGAGDNLYWNPEDPAYAYMMATTAAATVAASAPADREAGRAGAESASETPIAAGRVDDGASKHDALPTEAARDVPLPAEAPPLPSEDEMTSGNRSSLSQAEAVAMSLLPEVEAASTEASGAASEAPGVASRPAWEAPAAAAGVELRPAWETPAAFGEAFQPGWRPLTTFAAQKTDVEAPTTIPAGTFAETPRPAAAESPLEAYGSGLLPDFAGSSDSDAPPSVEAKIISLTDEDFSGYPQTLLDDLEEAPRHTTLTSSGSFLFNLHSLVREVHDTIVPLAKNKGLLFSWYITPSLPTLLEGDAPRLRGALSLLLQNAVQATRQGTVQLAVRRNPGRPEPGDLLFIISDSGSAQRTDAGFFHAWELAAGTGGAFNVDYSPGGGTQVTFTAHFSLPSEEAAREHLAGLTRPVRWDDPAFDPLKMEDEDRAAADAVPAEQPAIYEAFSAAQEHDEPVSVLWKRAPLPPDAEAPRTDQPDSTETGAGISETAAPAHAPVPAGTGFRSQADLDRPGAIPLIVAAEMTNSKRKLLSHYLGDMPHEHVDAPNNSQVIALVRERPVSLIIVDGDMPEPDIIKTLDTLRREEHKRGKAAAPVLALTNHEAQSRRMTKAGATHALCKPFSREGLREAVALAVPALAAYRPLPAATEGAPEDGAAGSAAGLEAKPAYARPPEDPFVAYIRSSYKKEHAPAARHTGGTAPASLPPDAGSAPAESPAEADGATAFPSPEEAGTGVAASLEAPGTGFASPTAEAGGGAPGALPESGDAKEVACQDVDLLAAALRDAPAPTGAPVTVSLPSVNEAVGRERQATPQVAPVVLGLSADDVTPQPARPAEPPLLDLILTGDEPDEENQPPQPKDEASTETPQQRNDAATEQDSSGAAVAAQAVPDATPTAIPAALPEEVSPASSAVSGEMPASDAPLRRPPSTVRVSVGTPIAAAKSGRTIVVARRTGGSGAAAGSAEASAPDKPAAVVIGRPVVAVPGRVEPLGPETTASSEPAALAPGKPEAPAAGSGTSGPDSISLTAPESGVVETFKPETLAPGAAETPAPETPRPEVSEIEASGSDAPKSEALAPDAAASETKDSPAGPSEAPAPASNADILAGIDDEMDLPRQPGIYPLPENTAAHGTAPQEAAQLFPLPGLDGEVLDTTLMPLVPGLVHALQDALNDVREGRDTGKAILVQEAAGRLAGRAEVFGLQKLGKIGRCVERAAEANDLEAVSTLLEDLDIVTKRYIAAIQECFQSFLSVDR